MSNPEYEIGAQEIDVWYAESVFFNSTAMGWMPQIMVYGKREDAEKAVQSWATMRNVCCARVSGPHKHLMPAKEQA